MLTIKNQAAKFAGFFAAAVLFLTACGPPGPRALFAGKQLLEQGKYPQAIAKLKTATALLSTNALAYSYLGLACHQAGQFPEAEKAYQQALALDPDLVEVRYNLGCLWLNENKFEPAKTTLTAYTLRRPGSTDGWLKLASAQLRSAQAGPAYSRAAEFAAAEHSFNEVLRLSPQNPEALTGIGVVRAGRSRPAEAVQFFNKALKSSPGYAPALLNLAVVAQEQLNDRQLALQKYRDYLALKPVPENATEVKSIVRQLEQELAPAPAAAPPPTRPALTNVAVQPVAKPAAEVLRNAAPRPATNVAHNASAMPAQPAPVAVKPPPATNNPKPVTVAAAQNPPPAGNATAPSNLEVVRVPAQPELKAAQDDPAVSPSPAPPPAKVAEPSGEQSSLAASSKEPKRSFMQRLFGSEAKAPARTTPLAKAPAESASEQSTASPVAAETIPPGVARYVYKNPTKPLPGNRPDAERAFAQGVQAHRSQRLPEAMQAYRRALQADPSYFDAWYNLGLAATEAANLQTALSAYETALAIRPQSLDARYNFALVLKQANYPADAAHELEKLLVAYPNDSRAHLALGNLYAQQLAQPAKARPHYVKVLETDPRNPQAGAIRYWLTDTSH